MKVIEIKKFGGPEVLEIKDVKIGKPGPKEVLIKNLSIGLNYIDVYHRTGLYPIPLPSGIGLEACGVIEEVGSEVNLFKIGDRVSHASMPIGAFPGSLINQKPSPPNPFIWGYSTAMDAAAATMASIAVPPFSSIFKPTCEAAK